MADERPHLCKADEVPAFSCASGRKTISLCASTDLDAGKGNLTYRFGTSRAIELAFPEPGTSPHAAFRRGVTGATGGGADYLRFSRLGTIYTLYSDYYRGREEDGLVVERGGKRISVLKCRGSAVEPGQGWGRIYKANLPQDEENFEVPGVTGR